MDKKFLACGIGNAIVDVTVKVEFHDLVLLGLEKNQSCLIDLDKKNKIEEFLKDRETKLSSGGSIANSIYTISSLYGNSAFIGALGDDEFGKSFHDEFLNNNISVSSEIIRKNVNTGVCFVFITPDAERTMAVFLGDSASIQIDDDEKKLIESSEYLLLEMYPISNDTACETIDICVDVAKNNDTKVVMSFSDKGVVESFPEKINKYVECSDIIFCNHTEAQSFSKTSDILSMINFYKERNDNKDYIITLGKNGVVAISNSSAMFVDAFKVEPIDMTGAGDMFLAAYIYAIKIGLGKNEALKKACYMSSKVICNLGARIFSNLKDIWNAY